MADISNLRKCRETLTNAESIGGPLLEKTKNTVLAVWEYVIDTGNKKTLTAFTLECEAIQKQINDKYNAPSENSAYSGAAQYAMLESINDIYELAKHAEKTGVLPKATPTNTILR